MRVTILGCGPSGGVPLVGCDCAVCTSTDSRDRRLRASVLVEQRETRVLIDTSPDLREQLLRAGVRRIDALIYTHFHADHVHGIDELRALNHLMNRPIPVYGDAGTLARIRARFGYVFEAGGQTRDGTWFRPHLVAHEIGGPFRVGGIEITSFAQSHGVYHEPTLGLRLGAFGYSTDVKEMSEEGFRALEGIDSWVVDCQRHAPNPAHSHVAQSVAWAARLKPRRTVLTHMDHSIGYVQLAGALPAGIEPAYDGMTIEVADMPGEQQRDGRHSGEPRAET